MPKGRIIAFSLYHGERQVEEGRFFVTSHEGVSCFGRYVSPTIGDQLTAPVFEGVVITHALGEDGSVTMELDLFAADTTDATPRQRRVLRSGLSMGADSGESDSESVMLGNEHEFVFRTQMIP